MVEKITTQEGLAQAPTGVVYTDRDNDHWYRTITGWTCIEHIDGTRHHHAYTTTTPTHHLPLTPLDEDAA